MFESVLERNLPPRQIGRGASLAIGVHAVVILAVLFVTARPAPVVDKQIRAFTVFSPRRLVQPGPMTGEGGPSTPRARPDHRSLRSVVADADKTRKRAEPSPPSDNVAGDANHGTAEPGPAADGPMTGGSGGPGGNGSGGTGASGTTVTLPFGEGMKRPVAIAQPAPTYTREASAARAEGTVSVRCVITVEGALRDCRILKGVPHMDGPVLEALSRWKYTPVTFQGKPVSVFYAINLRLVAP